MIHDLMYIELKTGYSDDGPAWIGYVKTSKSKKTIYFNNHAFQKYNGKIMIDRRAVNEYLSLIGERELPLNLFEVTDMEDSFPIERVNRVLNQKITSTDNFE